MGKPQEDEGSRPVKREVVSASANLEVISEENFARRLQGMSACINCQKERYSGSSGHNRNSGPRHHHNHHHHHHNNNNNNNTNNSNNNGKQGRRSKQSRRKQAKANTPIVIHLKDTLRSALQQRQRSFDTDSDVSVRSTDDDLAQDTFGDVSSIPEFIPQYMHHQPQTHHHPGLSQPPTSHSTLSHRREKSKKNLTALISVIEKAHHKDSCHIESNLVGRNSNRSKLSHLLNNAVAFSDKSQAQHRSIVECDNVDVICNDLHKNEKVAAAEPVDDTDSISDKSSVASSSEVFSDSDSQVVEESAGFEFTPEELQRLAEYTTGYPIYRYDCAPSECPECLSTWYSHQIYQYEGCSLDTASSQRSHRYAAAASAGTSSSRGSRNRSASHNESSEHDTTLEGSDNEGEVTEGAEGAEYDGRRAAADTRRRTVSTSSSSSTSTTTTAAAANTAAATTAQGYGHPKCTPAPSSSPIPGASSASSVPADAVWPWRKGGRQLWDIDISQAGRRGGGGGPEQQQQHQRDNPYPNSVYLDLTGTDVSISVYYHQSLLQDDAARHAVAASMLTPAVYATTASSLYSIYYSSYLGSPVYGLSLPLSFFNDNALPKIAMVPPHELKKCKYHCQYVV